MSLFEAIMLICFGAAWPFSIYKSWKSRACAGKSIIFLYIVLIGYIAGIIHKVLHSQDWIIALYSLNGLMVLIDIVFYYRNWKLSRIPVTPKSAT
ncbi:MAG: hypothetical protein JXB18_04640 [Sedimentisphaerales bacterium]|nr:hypothetical protein [Sedimentisphaerales bacterium]